MPLADQKAIVRRYLEEVRDQGRIDILDQLVAAECAIHRPEMAEPIMGIEAFKQSVERDSRSV